MRLLRTAAALLLSVAALAHAQRRAGFPHDKHAKLFPTCASCHAGIVAGAATRAYPAPSSCAQCHNDKDAKAVTWTPPERKATNLVFAHPAHATKSATAPGGTPTPCVSCHATQSDTAFMRVGSAKAASCIGCHAHQGPEHLADVAVCKTCHTTLAESRDLSIATIAAFPKPASHNTPDFAAQHAPTGAADVARCATCHARESCVRCHANASKVPAITQLATDARVATLMRGRAAAYTAPATHTRAEWKSAHGTEAVSAIQRCANCHTQPSCTSCHVAARNTRASKLIAALPLPLNGGTPGVVLADVKVHTANYLALHRTQAASGRLDCAGCHQQRECQSCHAGSSSRRYHPVDFVARHAPNAYNQEQTCTSCHRTETFCRSCHLKSNITSTGAKTGVAHAGQPTWFLQHGEAARRGLTGCTTCHQQRDCLRCHSSLGLKVNPHGPNFDASKVAARNRLACVTCHLKDPLAP